MSTIFTKIINGEIPSYKVAENDSFFAFLDIFPIAKGHTLVVPKLEIDYIFDIEDDLYKEYFLFSKKVGLAIEKVVPCERIGMAVVGLEVPHAHIHLMPINHIEDINFAKEKLKFTENEFNEISNNIAQEFLKL